MKRLVCLLLVIVAFLAVNALALEVPSRPLGRVSDYTNTLSTSEISELELVLAHFEQETTNQIAVVLIPTLEGDNLEDYSIRLAEKWKIGQKGKDNGVILLIVKQDRKIRIEVGYGLEGALPDSLAGEIIREKLAPSFRQNDFYGGIRKGLLAIIKATKGEHGQRNTEHRKRGGGYYHPLMPVISILLFGTLIGIAIVLIIFPSLRAFLARAIAAAIVLCLSGVIVGSRSGGFGGGAFGGGGGFSGGGGGFGGGGASGGW
jgi:uncharacterized protein